MAPKESATIVAAKPNGNLISTAALSAVALVAILPVSCFELLQLVIRKILSRKAHPLLQPFVILLMIVIVNADLTFLVLMIKRTGIKCIVFSQFKQGHSS